MYKNQMVGYGTAGISKNKLTKQNTGGKERKDCVHMGYLVYKERESVNTSEQNVERGKGGGTKRTSGI